MAKNIEMSHLSSDGSYEILYPKTMANIMYPSFGTLSLLGLPENSTVDNALAKLSLGAGKYGYFITLVDPIDRPMAGFIINGLESITGGTVITDENGSALGVSTNQTITVSVDSTYFDLNSVSQSVQSTGIITNTKLIMTAKYSENEIITISSS